MFIIDSELRRHAFNNTISEKHLNTLERNVEIKNSSNHVCARQIGRKSSRGLALPFLCSNFVIELMTFCLANSAIYKYIYIMIKQNVHYN